RHLHRRSPALRCRGTAPADHDAPRSDRSLFPLGAHPCRGGILRSRGDRMIALDQPTIYDEALYGEPLARPMRHRVLNTESDLWTLGAWRIVLPTSVTHRAPDVQRMIAEIRGWT